MRYVAIALVVVLVVIIAIFSVQNFAAVDVFFLAWSLSISKTLLVLGVYVIGMISGGTVVGLIRTAMHQQK